MGEFLLLVAFHLPDVAIPLVPDDPSAEALEGDLEAGCEPRLVFTLAEVLAMEGLLAADLQAITRIKQMLPGYRIQTVACHEGSE